MISRKSIFQILLVVILFISVNSCDRLESRINDIIDADYKKLIQNLQANFNHLRDYQEDPKLVKPLPAYKCQHDHIADDPPPIFNISKRDLGEYHTVSTRSINEANEIGNIRINFDTSRLNLNQDSYACYATNQVVKVDSQGSVSTACNTDPTKSSPTPCLFTCTSTFLVDNGLKNFIIEHLVGTIQTILTETIQVEQTVGNLKLKHYDPSITECHYGIPITSNLVDVGVPNTDYYVFVTARPTSDPNTIAYAKACVFPRDATQNIFGRPIAGVINFNPNYFFDFINAPSGITYREYARVGLHEMIHALGFSKTFYNSFVDPEGKKYALPYGQVTLAGKTPSGVSFSATRVVLATPSVAKFARAHYNCKQDWLEYQELENAGGGGTASSHWEKRAAGEEIMLGYVQPNFPLTNLTLALLQDTGWYHINYDNSEMLLWGKNLGCDWLSDCTPQSWKYPGYFCDKNTFSCSPTRAAKGICYVANYDSDLPYQFQHFTNPKLGGGDATSDYCPFSDYNSVLMNDLAYCEDESRDSALPFESYGVGSKCFEYTSNGNFGMSCIKQRCSGQGYEIYVQNTWTKCSAGKNITFTSQSIDYNIPCPLYYYPCLPVGVEVPPVVLSSATTLSFNIIYLMIVITIFLLL